jgi:hypothetical protein
MIKYFVQRGQFSDTRHCATDVEMVPARDYNALCQQIEKLVRQAYEDGAEFGQYADQFGGSLNEAWNASDAKAALAAVIEEPKQ